MKNSAIPILLFASLFFFNFSSYNPKKPVVYIVGDSTVKNGKGDGAGGLWGWGDFFGQFLDSSKVVIQNHALGGTSSRTFIDKGLWESVLNLLQKGDYVIIQFGHNDNGPINDTIRARGTIKGIGDETQEIDNLITKKHEIVHSYGWYIRKYVKEAKSKGAIPIVLSQTPRNEWSDNKVERRTETYSLWTKEVATKEGALYIDLNAIIATKYEQLGQEKVKTFFPKDHTHTNLDGAILNAEILAESLQKLCKNGLENYIVLPKK